MTADRQPRQKPRFLDEDLGAIGDRMREIWRQEDRKPADIFEPSSEPKPFDFEG